MDAETDPETGSAWQAEQFEQHRGQLQAVAYRMLGSVSEAEDAVQEAWLRLSRSDGGIMNIGGWLRTVVGRVCIDMLRARKARREHHAGTWLPEPILGVEDDGAGPEQEMVLADSVGLALLVVLETLSPPERLAFVLHDMFALPYEEIASVLDRSPTAARQLASRARRRVSGMPVPNADPATQREVAGAFLSAARSGDFDGLIAVLDPDVVFRIDAGPRAKPGRALLTGAVNVARHTAEAGPRFAPRCRLVPVNGSMGIATYSSTGPIAVAGLTVVDGLIAEIDLILDPGKIHAATASH